MTLVEVAIVVVACFLSMFLIIISCINSLEKRIDKYHRQELEAIDELKKSIEKQPWQYKEFDPNSWTSDYAIAWRELPDNMNEEVKHDGMC